MNRFLVLCFVVTLSVCHGSFNNKNREVGKYQWNQKINKLLNVNQRLEKPGIGCYDYGKSKDYRGSQSTTVGGRTCQHWNTNFPHKVTTKYIPYDSRDSNYCRDNSDHGAPWCYTTYANVRWETCDVPICGTQDEGGTDDCYEYNKSANYAGVKSTTVSGLKCQHWSAQCPHTHSYVPTNTEDLETNFCRDPSKAGTPWCYTTDKNVRWEYCDIPVC